MANAYAEFYFTNVLWPDFQRTILYESIIAKDQNVNADLENQRTNYTRKNV